MIASAQTIRKRQPISPLHERTLFHGKTYGLGPASYDIRAAESITMYPGAFNLGSAMETFNMPNDMSAVVHDKSSWAREGLCVQNTYIDPGFQGFLTLEYSNHSQHIITIRKGDPIAQIVFHMLDEPTELPYKGKYQNQSAGPQPTIIERS